MARNRLTSTRLRALTKPGRHADGDGLYLSIAKGGSKSWVFLWMRNGRRREMGLGSFENGTAPVSLRLARQKADEVRAILAEGGDPFRDLRSRRDERTMTFGDAADRFIEAMRPTWKSEKTTAQTIMTLQVYAKPLRGLPVDSVETTDVLRTLKPIWERIPETARRTRNRIERVLDYATAHGWRTGDNPARWVGNLKHLLPEQDRAKRGHHAAMPIDDVPALLPKLRSASGFGAPALELTILTAVRTSETLNATWDEFDLEGAVWTIPAARMKARKNHRVPLSDRCIAILRAMPSLDGSAFVFPGSRPGRPMSNMTLAKALKTAGADAYTVHGFRSTFRDWAGDRTKFPRELAEAALAHTVGDETERAYRRGDALNRRRELMNAWARFLEGNSANVTRLAQVR